MEYFALERVVWRTSGRKREQRQTLKGTRRLGSYLHQALRGIQSLIGPAVAAVARGGGWQGAAGGSEPGGDSGVEWHGVDWGWGDTAGGGRDDLFGDTQYLVIDLHWELQRRGFNSAQATHLLESGLGLRLSVYVGSRFDCTGEYAVCLLLDEGGAAAIPSLQSFVMRPSRHLGYRECEHMQYGIWQRFEYDVAPCA